MRLAVLVTVYNRAEVTLRGLRTLFAAKPADVDWSIYLVDDASTDGTAEKVSAQFPSVEVIRSAGNLYWCRGMHLAWERALADEAERGKFDAFIWFNDDVQLKVGAVTALIDDAQRTGGVVVGKFSSDAQESDIAYGMTNGWMNGNFVYVPRSVYERVGMIADCYHHAYGDYDYGMRVRRAGLSVMESTSICGVCPQEQNRYVSFAGRSLSERFKVLLSPKGVDIHDAVLFRYRNYGLLMAIVCVVHLVFRALIGR